MRALLLVSTLTFAQLGAAIAVASDFDDGNFDIKVSSDAGEFLAVESGFSPPLGQVVRRAWRIAGQDGLHRPRLHR